MTPEQNVKLLELSLESLNLMQTHVDSLRNMISYVLDKQKKDLKPKPFGR